MPKKEFEITLKLKVETHTLDQANTIANSIVDDLKKCGEEYVDRPINHVRWSRISPVFKGPLVLATEGQRADIANAGESCDGGGI